MAECLTISTVPERWKFQSSVSRKAKFQKIVGVTALDGSEFWIPGDPRAYQEQGAYSPGYSKGQVCTREVTFGDGVGSRFFDLFANYMIGRRWYDLAPLSRILSDDSLPKRYDCHWLVFWLRGLLDDTSATIEASADYAKRIVQTAQSIQEVAEGEAAVLGVQLPKGISAIHSFISLGDQGALQVTGVNGALAIAPQHDTVQHYRELAQRYGEEGASLFLV